MTQEQKEWLKEHLQNSINISEYHLRMNKTKVKNFETLKRTKNDTYQNLVNDIIPHIENNIKISNEILKTL